MLRLAPEVDRQPDPPAVQARRDPDIRCTHIDIRTGAGHRAQAIDHAVLDPARTVEAVAQFIGGADKIHCHRGAGREVLLPGQIDHALIQGLGITRIDLGHDDQHTARHP